MTELYDLEPHEVSLVDEGAIRRKFLIFKNREGQMNASEEILKMIAAVDAKKLGNLEKVVKSMNVKKEDGDQPLSDRAQMALQAVARILAPFKDELNDAHLDQVQHEIGIADSPHHEEVPLDEQGENEVMKMEKAADIKQEDHEEAMKSADGAYKAHLAKMGYQKYEVGKAKEEGEDEDEDGDEDEVEKSNQNKGESVSKSAKNPALDLTAFPEGQRSSVEAIFKANADLQKQNKELVEKQAKLEKDLADRDEREKTREYVAKAAEFKHVGIPQEEIVETLRDAAKLGEKSYERVVKQFSTMNEQAEKGGLFKEIGSRQAAQVGDAEMRLEKLVDSYVQKSDGKESRADVYDRVLRTTEGQKLYSEIKNSRPGGA